MDEAEHCDRIAIIDQGRVIALDTPEALKASVGKDRVQLQVDDDGRRDRRAARAQFGLEATIAEGHVTVAVEGGEAFVPRLFAELGVPIRGVSVARPSLDDVFMSYTGTTIRDAESAGGGPDPMMRDDGGAALMATTEAPPGRCAAVRVVIPPGGWRADLRVASRSSGSAS